MWSMLDRKAVKSSFRRDFRVLSGEGGGDRDREEGGAALHAAMKVEEMSTIVAAKIVFWQLAYFEIRVKVRARAELRVTQLALKPRFRVEDRAGNRVIARARGDVHFGRNVQVPV